MILFEKNRGNLALFLLAAIMLGGCALLKNDASTAGQPPVYHKSSCSYSMAALDSARLVSPDGSAKTVQVDVYGLATIDGTAQQVKGMPVEQFRSLLRRANPGVSQIEVDEFQPNRVTVLGEVFHQIHTDLGDAPMRVMDAIAAANGFTPLANKRRVKLIRRNADVLEVYELDLRQMMNGYDLQQDILLKPGDVITVPRNFL